MQRCRFHDSNFGVSKIGINYLKLCECCNRFCAWNISLHSSCTAFNRPDGQTVVVPASDDFSRDSGPFPRDQTACRWKRPRRLAFPGSVGTFPAANDLLSLLIALAYLFTLGLAYGREPKARSPPMQKGWHANSPLFPSFHHQLLSPAGEDRGLEDMLSPIAANHAAKGRSWLTAMYHEICH